MQDLISRLLDFFRSNEPILSSIANFSAILTIVISALSFFFGWWRKRHKGVQKNTAKKNTSAFPFDIVTSPDELIEKLLPDPTQRVIPDRGINYIPSRALELDVLFENYGRILIKGRSKAGKTREMAELLRRRWFVGYNVLLLRPNAWLEAPFVIPDEMPYRNVVLLINDIDHYCTFDNPLTGSDDIEPSQSKINTFPNRLQQALEHFEKICGSANEVRVVATIRREPEFWDQIRFDAHNLPWSKFRVFELEDLTSALAEKLINQLSQMTNVKLTDKAKLEMAQTNGGTFLNIILAFRDWLRSGTTLIDTSHIEVFEGELSITWKKRYEQAVVSNPINRYIYATLDILRRVNLIPHRYLVAELATRLEGSATAQLSRSVQTGVRKSFSKIRVLALSNRVSKRIADRYPGISRWISRVFKSKVGKKLLQYVLYEGGEFLPKGGSRKIEAALQRLVETEIPVQNDVLIPYDGQVDGTGDAWINSGVVSDILAERASTDEHFTYGLMSLAEQFRENRNYEAALRMLDTAIRLSPSNILARLDRSSIYSILKQYENALSDIDMCIKLEPSDYLPYVRKALLFRDLDKHENAIELIDYAISISPVQAWLYSTKAEILADGKRFDEACQLYDKAIELDSRRHWTYGHKATTLRSMKKYADALEILEMGIKIKPDDDWLYIQKGITLREMGRYEEALELINKVLRLDPKSVWGFEQQAITFDWMDKHDEALKAINKTIELDPKYDTAYIYKGNILQKMKQYDEALEWINKGLELNVKNAWGFEEQALTLKLIDKHDEALKAIDKTIELNPKYDRACIYKGIILREMERYDEALVWIGKGLELDPKNARGFEQQAIALNLMDRHDEALKAIDKTIELDPKDDGLYIYKGTILRKMKQYDEALEWMNKGLALNPKNTWALGQRGLTLIRNKDFEQALTVLNYAIEMDSNDAWLISLRGDIYRYTNRHSDSLDEYDKVISLESKEDWYYYKRALTLQALGQLSRAQGDLATAIQHAKEILERKPYKWGTKLNLAIYYLAAGETQNAAHIYTETLNGASLYKTKVALQDLDDFLDLFPSHSQARSLHDKIISTIR